MMHEFIISIIKAVGISTIIIGISTIIIFSIIITSALALKLYNKLDKWVTK